MTCRYQIPLNDNVVECMSDKVANKYLPASACELCIYKEAPDPQDLHRGFGDTIRKVTDTLRIKLRHCNCPSRQMKVNRIFPSKTNRNDPEWITVVTTAPRKEPTIEACLASLRNNSIEPVVFAEPGSLIPDMTEIVQHRTKKGVWENWKASVKWALNNTSAKVILTVQDDAAFHPQCKELIDNNRWPSDNTAFISLYTPTHYSRQVDNKTGIWKIRYRGLWGSLALAWRREALEALTESPIWNNWKGANRKQKDPASVANSDTAIGRMCNQLHFDTWHVNPSPVMHIARYSTIKKHGSNVGKRNAYPTLSWNQPLPHLLPKE